MRLALYQPDIPQNMGALMRLTACFKVPLDVIEPCGFPFDEPRLRRTAMDYGEVCDLRRHTSWAFFLGEFRQDQTRRLVLLTTASTTSHVDFKFEKSDTLLLGRESHGVPPEVHNIVDSRIRVPIAKNVRSLNVVTAAAICLAEGLRQLGEFAGKTEL